MLDGIMLVKRKHRNMDRAVAYVSSISESAREKVIAKYANGAKKRVEYYIGKALVGIRAFHPCGALKGEWSFHNGIKHGWEYRWDTPGELISATPYIEGVEHGTAYQWASDGRLIGSYTMEHGTGIDLWWQDWSDGTADLTEARYYVDGFRHGFAWEFFGQGRLSAEQHWWHGVLHGIERSWNSKGGLHRGFPRYWVGGERVTKPQYLRAFRSDANLPLWCEEENKPTREFPIEIVQYL